MPTFLRNGFKPDRSLASARVACAKDPSGDACVDPEKLEALLGDYYPHIQWYECQANGVLKPITKTLAASKHQT